MSKIFVNSTCIFAPIYSYCRLPAATSVQGARPTLFGPGVLLVCCIKLCSTMPLTVPVIAKNRSGSYIDKRLYIKTRRKQRARLKALLTFYFLRFTIYLWLFVNPFLRVNGTGTSVSSFFCIFSFWTTQVR